MKNHGIRNRDKAYLTKTASRPNKRFELKAVPCAALIIGMPAVGDVAVDSEAPVVNSWSSTANDQLPIIY
ncbi:hypothetical protein EJB05_24086, partial [Eragrostis curvula]